LFSQTALLSLVFFVLQGNSPWKVHSQFWPKTEEEYIVKDFFSAELEGLLKENQYKSSANELAPEYLSQMRNLCHYLEKYFQDKFLPFTNAVVVDKDGKELKETESSIAILLKTFPWLPAVETCNSVNIDCSVEKVTKVILREPGSLYVMSRPVQTLLSDKVLYSEMQFENSSLIQFLGLKNVVEIAVVKDHLLQWGEREKEDEPAVFCTSLEHMKTVYSYLSDNLRRQEIQELLREKPVIFIPNKGTKAALNSDMEVVGRMLRKDEVWLTDNTGLFDKYRPLLEEFHSDICRKRTIILQYGHWPEVMDLFRVDGKVDLHPQPEEYIELLILLCTTETPKDHKVLHDVNVILATIGEALQARPEGMPDDKTAAMTQEALKARVKKLLHKEKVRDFWTH